MLPVPAMAKFTCLLNVSLKKLFCFSFEFNENWQSCSYICVLKLHQVSLNSDEKQKSFLMAHLTDVMSNKGSY